MSTHYEQTQARLDRALKAAQKEARETRPTFRGIFAGHARKWLARAEQAAGDDWSMFADQADEVRSLI
jgi:hypothetical protein